jgi:hypothetical protein
MEGLGRETRIHLFELQKGKRKDIVQNTTDVLNTRSILGITSKNARHVDRRCGKHREAAPVQLGSMFVCLLVCTYAPVLADCCLLFVTQGVSVSFSECRVCVFMVKRTCTPCLIVENCTATGSIDVLSRTCVEHHPNGPPQCKCPRGRFYD